VGTKVHLVFAPHADDEILGCGGTVLKLRERGDRAVACIVGRAEPGTLSEAEEACRLVYDDILWLHRETRPIEATADLVRTFSKVLDDIGPHTVFAPHDGDGDPDHSAVAHALDSAIIRHTWAQHVRLRARLGYEIWRPAPLCTYVSDITPHMPAKLSALTHYRSQTDQWPLVEMVTGLNQYRAAQVGIVGFAEGFVRR